MKLFKKIILKDFFKFLYFIIQCSLAYRKISKEQKKMDIVNRTISNNLTTNILKNINRDHKYFNDIYATEVKDKHGKHNNGIILNLNKDIGNNSIQMGFDLLKKTLGICLEIKM